MKVTVKQVANWFRRAGLSGASARIRLTRRITSGPCHSVNTSAMANAALDSPTAAGKCSASPPCLVTECPDVPRTKKALTDQRQEMSMQALRSSACDVPDAALEDLRNRLRNTRRPAIVDTDWRLGPPADFLDDFCRYWRDDFDWRPWERLINGYDPTMVTVDGVDIHFIHARSPHPDATPLLVTHGWPGSIIEFLDLVEPLINPTAHGGSPEDAFHVVCPSLPGYGLSPPPRAATSIRMAARLFAGVMDALGYSRYLAQGGDWGGILTSYLAWISLTASSASIWTQL